MMFPFSLGCFLMISSHAFFGICVARKHCVTQKRAVTEQHLQTESKLQVEVPPSKQKPLKREGFRVTVWGPKIGLDLFELQVAMNEGPTWQSW